jgi:type IV fimbrial biogenesis protein FimT
LKPFNVNKQNAMTLVELLLTIALIGIISGIGIPSFQSLMVASRISSHTSLLHGSLLLARTESIKRGRSVTICRSGNANSIAPTCLLPLSNPLSDTGWGEGWIIYIDVDNNKIYSAGDLLIHAQGKLILRTEDGSIIPVPNRNNLTFNMTGQLFGSYMRFAVNRPDSDKDVSHDRFICIASGGRARVDNSLCARN